jgi:uncharacterized protein (UPF0332 family)
VKSELAALAAHRMHQARETLGEADQLLGGRAYRGAVNRLYYAAFYAARALLATRDLDAARHTGLISLFQLHFVKTGQIPAETGKALARAFEKRQNSDYADFATVDPADTHELATAVHAFVDACNRLLDRLRQAEP